MSRKNKRRYKTRDRPLLWKIKKFWKNIYRKALKQIRRKWMGLNKIRVLKMGAPYMIFAYFGNKIGNAYRISEGENLIYKIGNIFPRINETLANRLPSFNLYDIVFGIVFAVSVRLVVYYKAKNAKKFRKGSEYGSARWGTSKDIEPFMDKENPDNNIILTQTEGVMMGRPSLPKYARNKNVLVVGGSGSGKTRFVVKPNLMQLHSSYILTDPKGTVLLETGNMLLNAGYEIKIFNTVNFKKSMKYNPFQYIKSEKDILKLVNTLMVNTKGEGQQSSEDFWCKAERLLYQAYIGYIYYEAEDRYKNFSSLIDMINASETREEDEKFENAIDLMFKDLEADDPEHFAVRQYKKYKLAAGVTTCN